MKNTRLYFDKDFKPITKLALELRMPGATPNFETDMDVIVKGNATGVADRLTWIGTTRIVCESQAGVAFNDILTTPSLLEDQNNSTESDFDVFLRAEQDITLAGLEPLDGPLSPTHGTKYQEFVASKDIDYKLVSIDSIEVTDCVGNPVDVLTPDLDPAPGFILKIDVKGTPNSYATDGYIYFESSLDKILGKKYNPIIDKWFKIKITYTAGIVLTEGAKVYFEIGESSELKQRTATYYLVNNAVYQNLLMQPNFLGCTNLQLGYTDPAVVFYRRNIVGSYGACYDVINSTSKPNLQQILDNPARADTAAIDLHPLLSGNNGQYDYVYGSAPVAPFPPESVTNNFNLKQFFNDSIDNQDIKPAINISIVAEDSNGDPVTLTNQDFYEVPNKWGKTDDSVDVKNRPFAFRFFPKHPSIQYPSNFKWVKFTMTVGIQIAYKQEYRYKDLFDFTTDLVSPTQTLEFYVVNPDYQAP